MLLLVFMSIGLACVAVLLISTFVFSQRLRKIKKIRRIDDNRFSVGIFHPFCNSGSGEERILWSCVKALHKRYPNWRLLIYTGDTDACPEKIIRNAKLRFNIVVPTSIEFIYLHKRSWLDPLKYSYFSLLGSSVGSIFVGIEALLKFTPDIYIDTMNFTFTLPLFKYLGGCRVGCYVHSLLITKETIQSLSPRNTSGCNSSSPLLSFGKLVYCKIFSKFYCWAGRCSDIVMVNSSWTEAHLNYLWECSSKIYKIYPPCCVEELSTIPISQNERQNHLIKIVSLSPFKSEKDHPQQIRTLFQLRQFLSEHDWERVQLVLIGSCRNSEDSTRVKDMQDLCKHLSVEDNVIFKINISFEDLKQELSECSIGIHTMFNEQFGMGIVESMASGVIVVANKSGGPLMDIILEYEGFRNGFLASDELEYAEAIRNIMFMNSETRYIIRTQARASVDRFSEAQFEKYFIEAIETLL